MKFWIFSIFSLSLLLPQLGQASVCSEQASNIQDGTFVEGLQDYCDTVAKFCGYFTSSPVCMGDENPENLNKYKLEWATRHDQWLAVIGEKRSTVVKNIFTFTASTRPTNQQVSIYEEKLRALDLLSRDSSPAIRGAVNLLATDLQIEWMNTFSEVFSSWALFQENVNMWGPLTGFAATNYVLNSAAMVPKGSSSVFAFFRHKMPARLAIFSVPFLAGVATNKIGETPFEVPLSPAHMIHFDYSAKGNFKGEDSSHLFGMKDFATDPEVLKVLEDLENQRDLIAYSAGASATLATVSKESRKAIYGKRIVNVLRVVKGVTPMTLVAGLAIEAAVRGGLHVYEKWKVKDDLVEKLEALFNYSKEEKLFKDYHRSKGREDLVLKVDEKLAQKRSDVLHHINIIDKFYTLEDQSSYWAVAGAFNSLTQLVTDESTLDQSLKQWFKEEDDVLNFSGIGLLKYNYCFYLVNGYYDRKHNLGTIGTYALSIKYKSESYVSSLEKVKAVLNEVSSKFSSQIEDDKLIQTLFKARVARIDAKIDLARDLIKKAEAFELHNLFQSHFDALKKEHLFESYNNNFNEKRLVPRLINGYSCEVNRYLYHTGRPQASPCQGCHGGASRSQSFEYQNLRDVKIDPQAFKGQNLNDLGISEAFLKSLEENSR